jgi:ABC-type transport system involved in cytochrome c biogenesis permease subunit
MTQLPESQAPTRRWAIGLSALSGVMVLATFWMIFFYVPTESEMGIVQRIYYVHVPSAWVAFLAFGIVALCSLVYLWLRDDRLDAIALSAAEIGVVFTTIVLITGKMDLSLESTFGLAPAIGALAVLPAVKYRFGNELPTVLGKRARVAITRGTPLAWELIQ